MSTCQPGCREHWFGCQEKHQLDEDRFRASLAIIPTFQTSDGPFFHLPTPIATTKISSHSDKSDDNDHHHYHHQCMWWCRNHMWKWEDKSWDAMLLKVKWKPMSRARKDMPCTSRILSLQNLKRTVFSTLNCLAPSFTSVLWIQRVYDISGTWQSRSGGTYRRAPVQRCSSLSQIYRRVGGVRWNKQTFS